ncbi:acetyl-CoA carboxylase biotin carboxyl carrier protein [Micromonospora kangleipakensis]|uniref:Biotin carboxyl carrier protein of acetyl-CoA carboxylase n=1 Tax=Micromonospora kangleipakensis TaxID=1077942 RepID=A0A4Q8BB13_9ACTN|nr:acetyl-CoA carboxylase biotin carboxyl carrier protein [Micromonospora kangleipakensis]RZU74273.1 acetyl-CoA carboxylase biotin carboxyl carrier protein [Micromonospora kangleipakensis]
MTITPAPTTTPAPADPGGLDAAVAVLHAEAAMEVLHRSVLGVARSVSGAPSRISVRFGCASIDVEWPDATAAGGGTPVTVYAETPATQVDAGAEAGRHELRSPLVGTFYRAIEPGAKPFVEVGDIVEVGQQVGIVEAMKLMNPLVADLAGRVVDIPVADGEPVEYEQPLLVIEPWEGE